MAGGYDSREIRQRGLTLRERTADRPEPDRVAPDRAEPVATGCWVLPDGADKPVRAKVIARTRVGETWQVTLEVLPAAG